MRTSLILFLFLPFTLLAQGSDADFKRHSLVSSISLGAGKQTQLGSAGAYHSISIGRQRRFSVFYGLRYSLFLNQNKTIPNRERNGETILISPANKTHHLLNLATGAQCQVGKLLLGFNIDLVGIALSTVNTQLTYPSSPTNGTEPVPALTYRLNILNGGRDQGALNSEFYAGYRITDQLDVKAGLSHFFVQYAPKHASFNTDTGRVFYNLAFAGLSYRID